MKKLLLLLIIPILSFSQSWKFDSGKSDFDGSYKTAFIQGKGNNFPFNNPVLTINKFSNKSNINFYISEGGSFIENTGTSIKWVFDNEPDVIYSTNNFSYSSDGLIIFFIEFYDPKSNEHISNYEFIKKLKSASKVSVRLSNNYGKNDVTFSLKGSTKAIESVISDIEMNQQIKLYNEQKLKESKFKDEQTKLRDSLVAIADEYKITENSRNILIYMLNDRLGLDYLGKESPNYSEEIISSIEILPTKQSNLFEQSGFVDIFYVLENGTRKKIYTDFRVDKSSPLFKALENEKIALEKEKERISNILLKYTAGELQQKILSEIMRVENNSSDWSLKNIKNVGMIFSDYKFGKFWKIKGFIYLNNDKKIPIDIYASSLEINKKQLKKMGGKVGVEF